MAEALHSLGVEMAMVVHCGGLDELAPVAVAKVATVRKSSGVEIGAAAHRSDASAVCKRLPGPRQAEAALG